MSLPTASTPLLCLGDSYTIGEGVARDATWPHRVARALDLPEPRVLATTGWTVRELLDAMTTTGLWPARERFTAVTLLIGVNDQYRGHALETTLADHREAFARAVTLAGGDPARVVAVSIPDWGVTPFAADRDRARIARELDALNAAECAHVLDAGAHWVEVTATSRAHGDDPAFLAPDGLHPGAEAYAVWARHVEPAVRAALAGHGPAKV